METVGVEGDGLAVEADGLKVDFSVARHLAIEAGEGEAALPIELLLLAQWRDLWIDHHAPGDFQHLGTFWHDFFSDSVGEHADRLIDLRRGDAVAADILAGIDQVLGEPRDLRRGRVRDRFRHLFEHVMAHTGDFSNGHLMRSPGRFRRGTILFYDLCLIA